MVIYGLHLAVPLSISIISKGFLAVDLFFALSGFVLMHAYCQKFETLSAINYWQFIQNRLARIYPIYIIVLLTLGLLKLMAIWHWIPYLPILNSKIDTSLFAFISNILMVQAWHIHNGWTWNLPAWSISSEWFVYLLAPLVISACSRLKHPGHIISLYLLSAASLLGLHKLFPGSYFTYDFGNIRMLAEFCMGISMYHLYCWLDEHKVKLPDSWLFILVATLSLGLMAFTSINKAVLINLNIILILIAARTSGRLGNVLSSKPLFYLGEISYSLYIIHFPIVSLISVIMKPLLSSMSIPGYLLFLTACLISCTVLAHFSYRYIELPFRNILKSKDNRFPNPVLQFPNYISEATTQKKWQIKPG
jgi:peptidoglycan/LPS O-acetylase OafA/YrhL